MKRQNRLSRTSALVFVTALVGVTAPAFANTLPKCPDMVASHVTPGDCDLGIKNGDFEADMPGSTINRPITLVEKTHVPGWHFPSGKRTLLGAYEPSSRGSFTYLKVNSFLYLQDGEDISQSVRVTRGAQGQPTYIVKFSANSEEPSSIEARLVGMDLGGKEREIWKTTIATTGEVQEHVFNVPVTGPVSEAMYIKLQAKGSAVLIDDVNLTQTFRR